MLTKRQMEILWLVALGLTDRGVAAELRISRNTVTNHLVQIRERVGAESRLDLVLIALKQGLLPRDSLFAYVEAKTAYRRQLSKHEW